MQNDPRNIRNGLEIPREHYCDQPYVVQTDDGAWLCCMTTARGEEGAQTQHIVSVRSKDKGKTWEPLVDIEPPGPPEASYVTILKVPGHPLGHGRVYAFYNHNTDNLREVKADTAYSRKRVDTLGHFVFKFSDDNGKSWSQKRYEIPIRETQIDRENPYEGKVRFFWHVGRPLIHKGAAYVTLHKVGNFGEGFMTRSEGAFLRSDNILTERDPEKIRWETLPDGDIGLRSVKGPIAEEQSIVNLSDGSLYCVYRTTEGHPCHAYSRDDGKTWTAPAYMTYSPNGKLVKHPRAANFVWKASNGKFLYWFHNHGGKSYEGRNPAWLCGGVEKDGFIHWSQPEMVLYDPDPKIRISYPDFIEDNGRYYLTETQKTIARVHEIDGSLLEGLWNQHENKTVTRDGLVLDFTGPMPNQLKFSATSGFTLDFWWTPRDLTPNRVLLRGQGAGAFALSTAADDTLQLQLTNAGANESWQSDAGLLKEMRKHHVAVIADGGPGVVMFVIDGVLCDGGTQRQYGWGRISPELCRPQNVDLNLIPLFMQRMHNLRVYNRALRVSEAVANWRAGL
ncbi:MAG TPA: exo-alpha-sialidase [Abditibacteriaceae bacterium]